MNSSDIYNINDFYTIKLFLAQWDTNFVEDISTIDWLKFIGCSINQKLYKALTARFEPLLGTRRPIESISHQSSFKQHINHLYLHDKLHEHFAFYSRPLHESIRKDPKSIYTNKKLFYKLSQEDQFRCALEEIYTVATERLIIPFGYNPQEAKAIALKRLCIGLSKGYFNIFLLEHYFELLYSDNSHFEQKLKLLGSYE